MKTLRVQRITEQTEVGLPDEVMHRLGLVEGQRILVIETPYGLELLPEDPRLTTQVAIAEQVMQQDEEVLRQLAG
jgi:bifunctional DNA-binding transcriptional regulator/antitoxin component of YhaV-PrlF toxin-antitoxin module